MEESEARSKISSVLSQKGVCDNPNDPEASESGFEETPEAFFVEGSLMIRWPSLSNEGATLEHWSCERIEPE